MRMNQRQRARENGERQERCGFFFDRRAVQQEKTWEQDRPAKEQRALRNHHIRDRVDPT